MMNDESYPRREQQHVSVAKLRYCRNQVLYEKREEETLSTDDCFPDFEVLSWRMICLLCGENLLVLPLQGRAGC